MCRLYGFRSSIRSAVHSSLVAADNALAQQSLIHSDGWGLAYYVGRFPHLIKSDKRALGDGLYSHVSAVVATRSLVAHIRKATVGEIAVLNCHPFQHGAWTLAHNGEIAGFADGAVRGGIYEAIGPRFQRFILGTTDSEMLFYLFLSRLARRVDDIQHDGVGLDDCLDALREAVSEIRSLADDVVQKTSLLNVLIANGQHLLGLCCGKELYFSTYKSCCPERASCPAYEPDRCEAVARDGLVKHLIVASEPVAEDPNVWNTLGDGEYVAVGHGMRLQQGRLVEASTMTQDARG